MVPVLEQCHPVGEQHRRGAVGDHDARHRPEHPAQRLGDDGLGVHVERRQRVVEHQDRRRGEQRAGQRKPLPLTTGQAHALLADAGVEAERQVVDEVGRGDLERPAASCSSLASGLPSVRFSATDIENSVGSSNAVATACRSAGSDSSRMSWPSTQDRALGDVVEPRQQRHQHRLARTGRPDQGERLAGFDGDVDVAQRPRRRCRGTGTRRRRVPAGHRAGRRCRGPSVISRGASKISATRLAAVMDSCVIDSRKPSEAMGHTSDSIIVMNATSVPMVTRPLPAA